MRIGFLGLGNMGSAMASKLLEAGHTLRVYNRTTSRADALRPLGAEVAESATRAAEDAEVLINMLADDAAVEELLLGAGNVLGALPRGAVHVSMSTISVELSRRLAREHAERGQHYVAAPVLGRPEAAARRQLFVIAAGPKEQIERCRPVFEGVGQKTFIVSDQAAGANVVKLAANFLITVVLESLGEASALVQKSGIERGVFLEVLTGSLFDAPIYRSYGARIAEQRFEPVGFKLPLGFKDNRLLLRAAEAAAVPLPLGSLIHDRFVAALASGMAEADWSAIAGLASRDAGL